MWEVGIRLSERLVERLGGSLGPLRPEGVCGTGGCGIQNEGQHAFHGNSSVVASQIIGHKAYSRSSPVCKRNDGSVSQANAIIEDDGTTNRYYHLLFKLIVKQTLLLVR